MSVMAKKPPPSESVPHPAMADSHLDLSSFISGSSFVNVDPLIISPTAWTTSPSATAQRPPDEVQEDSGGGDGSIGGGGGGIGIGFGGGVGVGEGGGGGCKARSRGGGGGGGVGGGVVAVPKCASAESSVSLSVHSSHNV